MTENNIDIDIKIKMDFSETATMVSCLLIYSIGFVLFNCKNIIDISCEMCRNIKIESNYETNY